MKRILTIAILLVFTAISIMAADDANSFLNKAVEKIKNSKSISATCVISGNGNSETARLTMSGKAFKIESNGYGVWYDGKTQWTYQASMQEVDVTEPTAEELAQVNPLSVIDYFRANYTAAFGTSKNGAKTVILTAKGKQADIKKIQLQINTSTYFPSSCTLTMSNGAVISISISNIKTGGAIEASTFKYNKKLHPDAEIVDLR